MRDLGFEPVETGEYYFLSYNSQDAKRIAPLFKALSDSGIPIWYDKGIRYDTSEWEAEIADHITGCKAVLFAQTDGLIQKKNSYAKREYKVAQAFKKEIYVLAFDQVNILSAARENIFFVQELTSKQNIQISGNLAGDAEEICRILKVEYKEPAKDHKFPLSPDAVRPLKQEERCGSIAESEKAPLSNSGEKYYCFACMQPIDAREAVCPHCGYDNHRRTNGLGYLPECILGKRYLVGRKLGQGGFGITYIGRDLLMDNRIAVKEYFPTALGGRGRDYVSFEVYSESMNEFQCGKHHAVIEARAGFGLGSIDNVVRTYNVIEANNTIYIIMEYVEGETLKKYVGEYTEPMDAEGGQETLQQQIEGAGPMTFPEALRFFRPVFLALDRIHGKGIIHSDISPDNIMLRQEDGSPVLLDFGAARLVHRLGQGSRSMSHSQNIVKMGYSPIEQYSQIRRTQANKLDARSDEYALAATMYFALTGMTPIPSMDRMMEVDLLPLSEARAKRTGEPVQEARRRMQISAEQENALLKAMSLKQKDRYGSVMEFLQALISSSLKAGDHINFGHYPQTASGNDSTPIEWRVLEVQGDKALVISEYGLDAKAYHEKYVDITWKDCTLRAWLNGDFMKKAFSAAEQGAILTTKVDNSKKQHYDWTQLSYDWAKSSTTYKDYADTQDKIFLLSYAEANKYFDVTYENSKNVESRVEPTAYAIAQGAWHSDQSSNSGYHYKTADGAYSGWWWLRSPGSRSRTAAFVLDVGSLGYSLVDYTDEAVCPALWLDLNSALQ